MLSSYLQFSTRFANVGGEAFFSHPHSSYWSLVRDGEARGVLPVLVCSGWWPLFRFSIQSSSVTSSPESPAGDLQQAHRARAVTETPPPYSLTFPLNKLMNLKCLAMHCRAHWAPSQARLAFPVPACQLTWGASYVPGAGVKIALMFSKVVLLFSPILHKRRKLWSSHNLSKIV